jgi:hypothetical protein
MARYINARRKETQRKEEAQKKVEEDARRKAMLFALSSDENQSFKDVRTWRKQSSKDGPRASPSSC